MKNNFFLKKVVFLSILLLVASVLFTSCSKNSEIKGKWSATYKLDFNSEALDEAEYPFAANTECIYNLTFNDDNIYALSRYVTDDQKAQAIDGYKKLYTKLYKSKHTEDEINKAISETENCSSQEELIEELLLKAAKAKGFATSDDFICDQLGISTAEISRGTYKAGKKKITLKPSSGNQKKIVTKYNGNEITLTIDDETIVFTPVSLDKNK